MSLRPAILLAALVLSLALPAPLAAGECARSADTDSALCAVEQAGAASQARAFDAAEAATNASLASPGASGEFVVDCAAPSFVACSIAGAFAAEACVDIPLSGEECFSARVGLVGGASSVAVSGGGGAGAIAEVPASCSWKGTSGACFEAEGMIGLACVDLASRAQGYATVVEGVVLLVGPPALASAGCETVRLSPAVDARDAERLLESHFASRIEAELGAWDAAGRLAGHDLGLEALAASIVASMRERIVARDGGIALGP